MNYIYILKTFIILCILSYSFPVTAIAEESDSQDIIAKLMSSEQNERKNILDYISGKTPSGLPPELKKIILTEKDNQKQIIALQALKVYPVKKYLPLWLEILSQTTSFLIKKEVIDIIAVTGSRSIVEPLINELSNPFSSVRQSAIIALNRIGDDRMFPKILNMSRNPDPLYRVYALEAIYHMYEKRFYPIIEEMLQDENKSVRYYSLKCIENNRLTQALSNIRTMAQKDDDYEVRVKAIEILGGFKDNNSVYILTKTLNDPDSTVRYASALSLYLLNSSKAAYYLSNQLYEESDNLIKELIMDCLARLKSGGGYKGLTRMIAEETNPNIKIHAAYTLGRIDEKRCISILTQAIKDKDKRVRAEICNSLGYYKEKSVIRNLIEILQNDKERYVRSAALYSIQRINDKSFMLSLFDIYTKEKDPVIKDILRVYIRDYIDKSR